MNDYHQWFIISSSSCGARPCMYLGQFWLLKRVDDGIWWETIVAIYRHLRTPPSSITHGVHLGHVHIVDARHDDGDDNRGTSTDDIPLTFSVGGGSRWQVEDRRRWACTTEGSGDGGRRRGHTEGGDSGEGSDDVCGSRRRRGERRGRGRRGRGWRRVDGREECIERERRGQRYYTCASIQPPRVVSVPVPTLAADAIVDGDINLGVQLQSEDIWRGEWIAPLAPSITALSAPIYRAVKFSTWHSVPRTVEGGMKPQVAPTRESQER
jgi:hypothetical protein